MKHLFDATCADEIKQRILRIDPASEPRWGSMKLAQTLAHCSSGIHMATGEISPERAAFPAKLLGLVIKPLVFGNDKPFRRNSPSSPELFTADPRDFEQERDQLLATIDNFVSNGPAGCSREPHPFFGRLTPQQWAILMYKHVDHHLRQFGA